MQNPHLTPLDDFDSALSGVRRPPTAWFMVAVLLWLLAMAHPFAFYGVAADAGSAPPTQSAGLVDDASLQADDEAFASDPAADVEEDLDAPAAPRRHASVPVPRADLPRTAMHPRAPDLPLRPPIAA